MGDRKRLTRIYTRTGDQGRTRLVGGQEVGKDDPRIAAYGTVDELSSVIGVARAQNLERPEDAAARQDLDEWLRQVQNDLFHVGAELATRAEDLWDGFHQVGEAECKILEDRIDTMNETLGPLEEFILPGGGPIGAHLHLARTVCRRAECRVVELMGREPLADGVAQYLNRLSDFLFVAARWAARATGHPEQLWQK